MKKILAGLIAILSIFAVVVQFDLMMANRTVPVFETIIRFFSYFTILTNSVVAVYFTRLFFVGLKQKEFPRINFGIATAITIYITIVGLVYQLLLRRMWSPTGIQQVVDEILHTINPGLVIVFWILLLRAKNFKLEYRNIPKWLIFPLLYLIYVMIRGSFSGFFPYPFLDIPGIGIRMVVINSVVLTGLFILLSMLFVWFSKKFQ